MRFRRGTASRLALTLPAVLACRPAPPPAGPEVVDGLGRRVSLERPVTRIVSLAPAITELLFALDAGSRMVGRTRWCDYPAEAAAVPSVGDGLNPNVEAVAARRPDLVAMYATAANGPPIERLGQLGIPVVNLPMDRLADVGRSARLLGRLLGDTARADAVAAGFDSTLAALRAEARGPGRRVVIIVWDNPPIVIGRGSFLTELVELAGGRNLFADVGSPSATVSIETIAARDPDVILVASADGALPGWARRPEWQAVRAVRERRFGYMRTSNFEWPSLRAPDAVRELAGLLSAAR